ncbi:hypothetical protein Mapa_003246 [Marchantia paleacea]|nr:hypothetical protein Mapa_003246 [Marchantia paleacea]
MSEEAITQEAVMAPTKEPSQTESIPKPEVSSRWKCGVHVSVNVPVEEIWRIMGNFCTPEVYMTQMLEVKVVEGERNALNCVRYLKGENLDGTEGLCWAHERLLSHDDENHIQTYKLEQNSFGFTNYYGYIKISQGNDNTSVVNWSMEMDPLPGMAPPPNYATEMMAQTFKLLIKNAESICIQKKGTESESSAVASANA